MNSAIARRGVCLVIAAPSGGGKSSIARRILAEDPAIHLSVSATTREARPGEEDGVHYHFRTPAEFERMVEASELLEWANVFGNCYGTPRAPVEQALAAGQDVLFDIDWQGFRQLRAALPSDVQGVFLLPPSLQTLRDRLQGRGREDPVEIARRMEKATGELSHWAEFDHVVVNRALDEAVQAVRAILTAARLATMRQIGLADYIANLK